VSRKVLQLEIEAANLAREESPTSAARLEAIKNELEHLKERQSELEAEWQKAQDLVKELAQVKKNIEDTLWAIGENERRYQVDRVSSDLLGHIPQCFLPDRVMG
jgi:chromosome segregation ATPase